MLDFFPCSNFLPKHIFPKHLLHMSPWLQKLSWASQVSAISPSGFFFLVPLLLCTEFNVPMYSCQSPLLSKYDRVNKSLLFMAPNTVLS